MRQAIEADDILEAETESEQEVSRRMAVIEAYALIMKEKRKAAIDARRASGIETIWQEDEDAYEGLDQFNRTSYTKGRTTDSGLTETRKPPAGRSTVLPNITRPYCDAAAARVADMLLPTDDRNWAIRNTPNPKLIKHLDDTAPAIGPDGLPMTKPAGAMQPAPAQKPGMFERIGGAVAGMFNPAPEQAQETQPVTVGEVAQQEIDKAKVSAERAQTVIDDYLVECRYHAEVRKVIESTTRIGTGILKGPHPTRKKTRTAKKSAAGWQVAMEIKTAPVSLAVDPWNFYPDGNCGDDIQNGSYCFERDDITARGLRELKGPGYINQMIDLCLEEGPISSVDGVKKSDGNSKASVSDNDLFEIWYGHISVSKKDMEAAGCECEHEYAPAVVTMVNDRIIKITLSPLDSGEFPYDVMVWQSKIGSWAGIGVARHIRTCQQGLTGAVRSLMDNNAISSGPQFIMDTSKIEPQNGRWEITPNKIWRKKVGTEDITDVRQAMMIVSIETRQAEILNIVNYWTREAENVTGLPMLLQGQQGNAPNTLGATQIVNNNSSTVLRRIARTFDDRITERHIGRYYEWVLLHGPDDAKGDFQIDARGSSALIERDMQNQAQMQLLGMSLNPAYGFDPEKVAKEVVKGMRLDHKNFAFDEEQKKAMAERQPPEDPRITAAKIMMEGKLKSEEMETKQLADRTVAEARMALERQNHEARENAADRKDVADGLKVKLTDTTLKLKMQEKLTHEAAAQADDHVVAQHRMDLFKGQAANPAVEPIGQAPAGEAFIK
ncbi:MAG: hypothetical protein WC710_14495 [Gallionella sp.]|jgi:hypothetical protein